MDNPYSWNSVNPKLFYGRVEILNALLSGLPGSPRFSFGIAGGRRMGKTTLLRRVELELQASVAQWRAGGLHVIPLYVDGLLLPRPLTASDVWHTILTQLARALPEYQFDTSDILDVNIFREILQPVLMNMTKTPRIVVLFDEIELILACEWANGFLGHWRALLSQMPGFSEYFTAAFAGARQIDALKRDIGSPLQDILEWRSLRCLDYNSACDLMQEPIEREWTDEFLNLSYQQTGGHPMLLQYVMQQICMNSFEDEMTALRQAYQRFGQERRWQFADWWNKYCTPSAQRIYARLPDDGSFLPRFILTNEFGIDPANEALEILQHVGLIRSDEDETAFAYFGEMFRGWYRKYGMLTEAPLHDSYLHARLAALGGTLADKYISSWQIYQTDLPNYSGAVAEMRGILEQLLDRLAPDQEVQNERAYKPINTSGPTLRQKVQFVARKRYNSERAKEVVGDYDLLETECEQVAQLATTAYRSASNMTHNSATRDKAYQALKQWDSIFAHLLPPAF